MEAKPKKSEKVDNNDSVKKTPPEGDSGSQDTVKAKHGPLVEAAENIEEGARIISEKVSEVAGEVANKTSEIAGTVYDKVKETVSDVVDIGTRAVDDLSQTAQNYIEKYKNKAEISKISEKRNGLTTQLGSLVYLRYKVQNTGPENLFNDKEISSLIKEIEAKDKEIIKIGKEIEDSDK